ncbi:hypothetical protein D6219_05595 [Coxiella burnetii]|nr:hypothetical protein D6219_05595 [Coxiella burnetii]PNT85733.1 hypothetical protein C2L93_04215 [Coxiella burnetii]QCP55495.1 hypothetical protein FDP44_01990 [Coxiella burnetii]
MDLLLFLKIEILCWRIMTPSLRGGSISLGYLATRLPRRLRKPTLSIAPVPLTISKSRKSNPDEVKKRPLR